LVAKTLKIVLFCRSLHRGGAERQILYLAQGLQRHGHHVTILTLYSPTPAWYDTTGLTVVSLGKKGRWDIVGFLKSYARFLKEVQPDVLYSFLTVQNTIAALTSLFTKTKVICGVRASFMDFKHYPALERFLNWVERRLFRLDVKIIANSYAGRDFILHKSPQLTDKITVITNGIDLDQNAFSAKDRTQFRSHLDLKETDILIGHVGRYDPMKDHKTFIDSAAIVLHHIPNCHFLCWGHGNPRYTHALKDYANSQGVPIIWHSENTHPCYSAFDLYCVSSAGEGYSNTLAEAMAHGIPCVTTDVGDCRKIIDQFGLIVPPSHPPELARAMVAMLHEELPVPNPNQVHFAHTQFTIEKLITHTINQFNT
jgi:glycosyltransferase involved in cell wall biosynthesis